MCVDRPTTVELVTSLAANTRHSQLLACGSLSNMWLTRKCEGRKQKMSQKKTQQQVDEVDEVIHPRLIILKVMGTGS